ncbi:MAG: hypothetical protein HY913_21475 [Desulfomonile tiedjei]|nr:hypothetical protein [Desulfomonile tiedjei]
MRINSLLGVFVVVFSMVSMVQAWNYPPAPPTGTGTVPNATHPSVQSYAPPAQTYGGTHQPPAAYQGQPGSPDYSSGTQGDPAYPYPPYHNPYYEGAVSPRNFLSGTIDWVFSLPSNAIDSFSNFLDSNFFPRAPATSGGAPSAQPQGGHPSPGAPANSAPLPPASVYGPPSR